MTRCNLCSRRLDRAPLFAILCADCEPQVPNVKRHLEATLKAAKALTLHRKRHPGAPSPMSLRENLFSAYASLRFDIGRARERGPRTAHKRKDPT